MYLDAWTDLATWFHAMDHTNYARWIPVHLRDMITLPTAHPEIATELEAGNFTIQKTYVDSSPLFQSTRLTSKTMLQSKETAGGENESPRRCHPETQAQSLRPASECSGESANQVKSLKNDVILSVVYRVPEPRREPGRFLPT